MHTAYQTTFNDLGNALAGMVAPKRPTALDLAEIAIERRAVQSLYFVQKRGARWYLADLSRLAQINWSLGRPTVEEATLRLGAARLRGRASGGWRHDLNNINDLRKVLIALRYLRRFPREARS